MVWGQASAAAEGAQRVLAVAPGQRRSELSQQEAEESSKEARK